MCWYHCRRRKSRRRRVPPPPRHRVRLPCFCLTSMRAQLTCGPRVTVTVYSKASSNFQIWMLFCKICISSFVDPNWVVLILLNS